MVLVRRISNNSWNSVLPLDREGERKRGRAGGGKRINKEGHDVVRDMINVADRERNRTSWSGTKDAFGLTLQGSVVPLPHGRRDRGRNPSIGRHPVSFSILLVRSVSCAYLDTYLTALMSFFDKDTPSSMHESQIDWTFIRINFFSYGKKDLLK